jgi:hypothetical protein
VPLVEQELPTLPEHLSSPPVFSRGICLQKQADDKTVSMKECPQILDFEEFEDNKGVIRIRKSKKNRKHNGQEKKYKRTTTIYTKHTHKTKD